MLYTQTCMLQLGNFHVARVILNPSWIQTFQLNDDKKKMNSQEVVVVQSLLYLCQVT